MGDFDVLSYCRQLRSLKPPPYPCPVPDCDKVYLSMTGFQYHLAHIQHSSPIPPLNLDTSDKQTPAATPASTKVKSKKKKGRRVTFTTLPRRAPLEIIEPVTPVLLSKSLCELEVSDNKLMRFNVEDHLPIISKSDYIKELKPSYRTSAILSSLSKSKEAVQNLPQAAYKEVDSYDIPPAPPMPNSYIRFIEKSVEELDTEVEYDMDEEDAAWLQIMNEKRESSGLVGISIESFELLMDRLEKESYFLVQMNKEVDSSLAVIDDEAVCSICLDGECQNSNVILFCDMCNLAVHQDCYGVPYIPEGQWLCRRCLHSPSCMVDCVLCPNNCGAFKQTDRGLWAHVVCALWIPEVRFANTVFLEPIDSIETIPTARWKLTCYICKQRGVGACIQCHKTSCYAAFHVTCAQQAGLYMKMETISNDMSNIGESEPGTVLVQKIAFCDAHAPADYLAENRSRQSPSEKVNNARRVLAKKRHAAPVISIPTIPPERVTEIANLLTVPKKNQFVQRLIAYWTLKRQFRNGVPLLRRLQTSQTSSVSRREEPVVSGENEDDLLELYKQLKYWQALRQDLERVRLLCELIRKRERTKKEFIKVHEQYTMKSLWPFNAFLNAILQQLIAKDTGQIFIEPVDQNEVPDYGDIVKHPMDLQTMETKIKHSEYNSFEDFENDFNLMIANCLAYNSKETIFYKAGIKMRDQGGTVLRTAKRDLKLLELEPMSLMLTNKTKKDNETPILQEIKTEEIKDEITLEFDKELKEICNPSNTMGDDDRMCKLLQLADKCHGGRQSKRARLIKSELSKLKVKIDTEANTTSNDETVDENDKVEEEKTTPRRTTKKNLEQQSMDNFIFKKPDTPNTDSPTVTPRSSSRKKMSSDPFITPPLIRHTRQSANLESFKAYRSNKKTDTEDESPSDEESSYFDDSESETNSSSSTGSGSGSSSESASSSSTSSDSESEKEQKKKGKKDDFAQLQLVWAKCRGYPWYPALIIDPNMPAGHLHNGIPVPSPPSEVLNLASNYKELVYLVLFFDAKRTWQWLPRNKLEPLGVTQELDDIKLTESKKPADRKSVRKAYMEALVYKTDPMIPSSTYLRRSNRS
ncbi:bromodomain-containing protein homolog [Daktulosphaira vitifoliae]|uniref:bromodomain-containing protein homolog n=1 Tax=Daktulosphaira vitifoliae TaxID=58002 RepID=UPI0021AAF745|nr:bromodomain-containing protein homolog [Daktulosphaira vitifoliae]